MALPGSTLPGSIKAAAYALVAMHIASNDGKYAYRMIRPSQWDPSLTTLFPPPNHPSYPANHSVHSSAGTEILAYLFPEEAAYFRARGEEAGFSLVWGWNPLQERSRSRHGVGKGRRPKADRNRRAGRFRAAIVHRALRSVAAERVQ
jgi:hypothetical protein